MMSAPDDERSPRGLLPRFTLKDGNMFLLADALGDIQGRDDGLFLCDTRVLSHLEMLVAAKHPSLLGASISDDNTLFVSHLTNRPLPALGECVIPQGVIHIERTRYLWEERLYERLRLTIYGGQRAPVRLQLRYGADFADIFEVQGQRRSKRGEFLAPTVGDDEVSLAYRGLDAQLRTTQIRLSPAPAVISAEAAEFTVDLAQDRGAEFFFEVGTPVAASPSRERFEEGQRQLAYSMRLRRTNGATVESSGRLFNEWLEKSRSDLALLTTPLPSGPYPYAGIPWFATQFGRDALIASLQTLWLDPALAAGVLRFLALTQAHEESGFRDAEPGKILHEMRRGEMAALQEVPFQRYYGGVDSTPLFVMLAGAYEERTGDRALVEEIWPNLLAATAWIERRLERSVSGFLDYARARATGLANQGWKDSHDSIFHADGRLPHGPVAVVEVQGYAHAALEAMARLALRRGKQEQSNAWRLRAQQLRAAIEERFWVEEMQFYAIAIDGEDSPCCVRASNAGHLLFCGIPNPHRALLVARQLQSQGFCNGWGIRTLAEGEPRYNPMSYHNGAVWPHDTSLCAAGIARYLGGAQIMPLISEVFEAANQFTMRLPELYCGFSRGAGRTPTPYPVACLPQAWASGAVFMLLQACLGIRIDGERREIHIERPALPIGIESLHIRELRLGTARIELQFQRTSEGVLAVPLSSADSDVQVLIHC